MDATTQLQFWVSDSKLYLASVSKSNMLGFYDLTMDRHKKKTQTTDASVFARCQDFLWGAWMSHNFDDGCDDVFLSVRYKFDGKLYEIIVRDDEELFLPYQYAREVANA